MSKNRKWCFTLNNYSDKDKDKLTEEYLETNNIIYLIYGKEIAPKTGTPHYQGFVYFKNAIRLSTVKKVLWDKGHYEIARGTVQQNIDYCSKTGNVTEHGTAPAEQGKRNDLVKIYKSIKSGVGVKDLLESEQIINLTQLQTAEKLLKYAEPKRTWKPTVIWIHGETGVGKTRYVYDRHDLDEIYTTLDNIKWWDGYDQHEVVLVDDFRKDYCKFHQLLKLLDRYPYPIEIKGATRQMLSKYIYITCPYPPEKVYETREDVNQLLRRIDEVIHISK